MGIPISSACYFSQELMRKSEGNLDLVENFRELFKNFKYSKHYKITPNDKEWERLGKMLDDDFYELEKKLDVKKFDKGD